MLTSGYTGLFVYDNSVAGAGTADATFDNFSVIPEPGTVSLVGLGLAAWLLRRRRRRA